MKNISFHLIYLILVNYQLSYFDLNKHKKIDAGGEELNKIWKETKDENEVAANKLSEPFPPTTIDSLKPYIFDDIFQKKLH